MLKSKWVGLILLLVLGLSLRLAHLSNFPPSLNWDEASLGYNAYSLLQTGRDEWGQPLPTIFRAFGDYKLPGYIYAAIVPIKIFGLNEVAVRLPSVIAGVILMLLGFVIGTRLFKHWIWGTYLALFIGIAPWSWFLSRVAVEANLALMLVTLGICLLIFKKNGWGILFLGLSAWTYNSARIFAPAFLLVYFWQNRHTVKLRIGHYALLLVLFIPIGLQLLSPSGKARYKELAIIDLGAIGKINNLQQQPGGRLVYNKATYFITQVVKNYVSHFSPNFLFINGGTHHQFSVPNHGVMYLVFLPFFFLGLDMVIRKIYKPEYKVILTWLLLAALPGSLTRDAPHPLRAIFLLPPVLMLIVIGFSRFQVRLGKWATSLLLMVLMVFVGFYFNRALGDYNAHYSWAWQYGYSQAIQYVHAHYSEYDQVIFTKRYGEPHEFVLFYWPWDPQDYQLSPTKDWNYHDSWYWVDGLDKFRFVNDWEMGDEVAKLPVGYKYMVVSSPDHESAGHELFRTNFLDDKPAFIIKEITL